MKHLFIINPVAKRVKNKSEKIKASIVSFFHDYPDIEFEVYISSWCRDSVSYIRSYITDIRKTSQEIIRVHAIGGTGTLFEVVNGVYGLKNVEVAAHPYGTANAFIRYFGKKGFEHFKSIKNMVFGDSYPVDLIKCGNNYGITFGAVGLEAAGDLRGDTYIDKKLPADLSYAISGAELMLTSKDVFKHYKVQIDGQSHDGYYASFLAANTPCYGVSMCPAPLAHPDDGLLDFFMVKKMPRLKMLFLISSYTKGNYQKIKEVCHFRGKKITLTANDAVCMNIDGETFFGMDVEFELVRNGVKIVCPKQIDFYNLPRIFNKPESGTKREAMNAQQ